MIDSAKTLNAGRVGPRLVSHRPSSDRQQRIAEKSSPPLRSGSAIDGLMRRGTVARSDDKQKANDDALKTASQESSTQSSPITNHVGNFPPCLSTRPPQASSALPTPPGTPTRPTAPPLSGANVAMSEAAAAPNGIDLTSSAIQLESQAVGLWNAELKFIMDMVKMLADIIKTAGHNIHDAAKPR